MGNQEFALGKPLSASEPLNESQETRLFDYDQIRGSMPRPGLVLRQRYRLDSELGRGAMGVVFRATDLELLRTVAVKILALKLGGDNRTSVDDREGKGTREASGMPGGNVALEVASKREGDGSPEGADPPENLTRPESHGMPFGSVTTDRSTADDMRSRFLREARAAAALNHPNIVAVYDVGEDHGFPFFVMELVDGPNLGQTPPHDLQQVVEFACQICAALEHAHAQQDRASRSQTRECSFVGRASDGREACRPRSGIARSRLAHFTRRHDRWHRRLHGARAGIGKDR